MDFLFPLHIYLAENYAEVKVELEQLTVVLNETETSKIYSISNFSTWLEKLSQKSPEGSVFYKPEVGRLRHFVLDGLLRYSRHFPSGSRLSGMLDVDCPVDDDAFRRFAQYYLSFDNRYNPPTSFTLKDDERLLAKLTEDAVTFRREQQFRLPGTHITEDVAQCSAPLNSAIGPGTLGQSLSRLRTILKEAWQISRTVVDKPELWTHNAPSAKRLAIQEAQDAVRKAVATLSPEMLSFIQKNRAVWYQGLPEVQEQKQEQEQEQELTS